MARQEHGHRRRGGDARDEGNLPEHLAPLSRGMARILRHAGPSKGISFRGPWCAVDAMLQQRDLQRFTPEQVRHVVKESFSKDRPRFELAWQENTEYVRATHKHTVVGSWTSSGAASGSGGYGGGAAWEAPSYAPTGSGSADCPLSHAASVRTEDKKWWQWHRASSGSKASTTQSAAVAGGGAPAVKPKPPPEGFGPHRDANLKAPAPGPADAAGAAPARPESPPGPPANFKAGVGEAQQPQKFCSSCNAPMPAEHQFCGQCGARWAKKPPGAARGRGAWRQAKPKPHWQAPLAATAPAPTAERPPDVNQSLGSPLAEAAPSGEVSLSSPLRSPPAKAAPASGGEAPAAPEPLQGRRDDDCGAAAGPVAGPVAGLSGDDQRAVAESEPEEATAEEDASDSGPPRWRKFQWEEMDAEGVNICFWWSLDEDNFFVEDEQGNADTTTAWRKYQAEGGAYYWWNEVTSAFFWEDTGTQQMPANP